VLKFDTVSHEWTLLAPMNGRGGCSGSSVYLDGFIYTTIGEIFERFVVDRRGTNLSCDLFTTQIQHQREQVGGVAK